ncbi:MAG TPA: riboflavin synthase [Gemmatimonadaceae bacterium]|nr:riboflavin synthase [Gemmatimonadaceae bacterium]
MFTGLIEEVGEIISVRQTDAGRELRIRSSYSDLVDGESIAVNGACLTVREHGKDWFTTAAVTTTLDRTTIADWKQGTRLNIERSLRVNDRLGGHIVQGHVDFIARVTAVNRATDAVLIDLEIPRSFESLFVLHGSVAVDGVSLTVNDLLPRGIQLSLIEYTLRHTTLGDLTPGARVHVEADVVAKHVRRLLEPFLREQSTLDSLTNFSLEH